MSTLWVEERPNFWTVRVDLRTLDQQVFCDLLVGDNDKVGAQHLSSVDRSISVGPFLELEPHVVNWQVVHTTNPWYQSWSGRFSCWVFPSPPGVDSIEEREQGKAHKG